MERLRRGHGASYADRLVSRWTRIRRRIFSSSSSSSSSSSHSSGNTQHETRSGVSEASVAESRQQILKDPECEALLREYEEAKKENERVRRQYELQKQEFKEEMRKKIDNIELNTRLIRERMAKIKSIDENTPDVIDISSDDSEATILLDQSETLEQDQTLVEKSSKPSTSQTKIQKILNADWKLRANCRVVVKRLETKKKPTIRNVQIVKSRIRITKDKILKLNNETVRKLAKANAKDGTSKEVSNTLVPYRRSDIDGSSEKIAEENKNREDADIIVSKVTLKSENNLSIKLTKEYYDCIKAIKREQDGPSEEYVIIEEVEVTEAETQSPILLDKEKDENNNQESTLTQPVSKLSIDGVSPVSPDTPKGGKHEFEVSKDEIQSLEVLLKE